MRTAAALSVLASIASAQLETFGTTTTADSGSQATSTASASGPIATAKACGQIAGLITKVTTIDAELAYACLKSVPINKNAATDTLKSVKNMVEFQSTLSYLKTPPKGYKDEAVDIQQGLDDISKKVSDGDYDNEYDFEIDISRLFLKARDGHLTFNGMMQSGVFSWRRNRDISLVSGTVDDKQGPKIWSIGDFNKTMTQGMIRSAVSQINGKDAAQFIRDASMETTYHDPDSRYNSMFYMQPAESWGYFANPRYYPGPSTSYTFENKTTREFSNSAVVLDPQLWLSIEDGQDFYDAFIAPDSVTRKSSETKRSEHRDMRRTLQYPREAELERRQVPSAYPPAVVEHTSSDVKQAGYFVQTSAGQVGVLMLQTFQAGEGNETEALEFQNVVQTYISQAKENKVDKHIIDVRANGGGKILLGYDTFLQFFPDEKPKLQARWRGHKASELLGEKFSTYKTETTSNGVAFSSPFNSLSYLNRDDHEFADFKDMYPPQTFNGDPYTSLLKMNLSDTDSIGITMTGYGSRSKTTSAPFNASNIILLSDGTCASTCGLFTELMVQQAGVKTLAVGGVPGSGPMQVVGGTKGSMLMPAAYILNAASIVVKDFASTKEESEWTEFLPQPFAINVNSAGVNFQDTIRAGLEEDGIPTQFLNDTASCRIYYEPDMYVNVTALWSRAAEVAFGKDGGMDESRCVAGSVTSKEDQTGKGEGSPTSTGSGGSNAEGGGGDGGAAKPSGTEGAAAGLVRPAQGAWGAVLACGAVVLGSLAFGASLV